MPHARSIEKQLASVVNSFSSDRPYQCLP